MKDRMKFVGVITLLTGLFIAFNATAAEPETEMFGVKLLAAERSTFRTALAESGVQATREDNRYWVDTYNSSDVLQGSRDLYVGYVNATDELAYVQYFFPSRRSIGEVNQLVSSKYGRPTHSSGSERLGPYSLTWRLQDGVRIHVSRGWPDRGTTLKYEIPAKYADMNAEIAEFEARRQQREAEEQSNAF